MERATEEAKSLAQQQQQQLMLQQQQHHLQQQQQRHLQQQQLQQHQQMLLLHQQMQQQKHHQQQQQQQQAASALSRFPPNHLGSFHRPTQPQSLQQQQQQIIPSINPNPNHPLISNHPLNPNPNPIPNPNPNPHPSSSSSSAAIPKVTRNPAELQMSYQDLWRVCHPDYKTPFSSLQDACERLLPYHVVADYEAEEDDRILDSDTTGQMLSRSQQWDHNIAAKVAEFAETFGKQVLAFNIVSNKRALGEFRLEERLLIEKLIAQEDRQSLVELREELESRQNAGREANLRMAAMVHAEQARAESQAHAEMMARGPIRPNALGSQGSDIQIGHGIADQEQEVNPEEMIDGWGRNAQRDENEPAEDFLNDEETENGGAGMGEFDLNTR